MWILVWVGSLRYSSLRTIQIVHRERKTCLLRNLRKYRVHPCYQDILKKDSIFLEATLQFL